MLKKILTMLSNDKAILIKSNGSMSEITPMNGTDFKCKELYKILKCELVECAYPMIPNTVMICDEEGLLVNKCPNIIASKLVGAFIVGDVVLCKDEMFK